MMVKQKWCRKQDEMKRVVVVMRPYPSIMVNRPYNNGKVVCIAVSARHAKLPAITD